MQVKKTITTAKETASVIDLKDDLVGLPTSAKRKAMQEIGDYLLEQTLISVRAEQSPVNGEGKFPALKSKEYKVLKKAEVGNTRPNLELTGEMLDSLDYVITGDTIEIGIFGKSAPKADGHNNLSGESSLPKRRFLPDKGQEYKPDIQTQVDRIVADYVADSTSFKKSDFKDIQTKADLYEELANIFGNLDDSELRLAVLRSDDIFSILTELNLEELL